jgi:hypothetical protein
MSYVCEYDYTSCSKTRDEINKEAIDHISYLYPRRKSLTVIDEDHFYGIMSGATITDRINASNFSIKHHPNVMVYERLRVIEVVFNPGLNAERWSWFKF